MGVYFDFASRGRNVWWRYLLSLVLACLLAILVLTILAVILALMHLLPPDVAAQIQQPKYVLPFYLGVAATFGALAVGLMIAVIVIQQKHPGDVIGQWRWDNFAWGFGIWLVVQAIVSLIDVLISPHGFVVSATGGTAGLAVAALVGILVQTFAEEFVFRGYLTQGLVLALKEPLPASIVSGLMFGSLHIANGVPQALNAVAFGTVCAMIAIRTGGIALTWGLHLANNYFGAVIVVSGNDVFNGSPGIFEQNTPQLAWWDLFLAVVALGGMLWLILRRSYFAAAPTG
jgi:membrane protease YdiL (CAAX protease family)